MATIAEPRPRPVPAEAGLNSMLRWVATVDHKKIGIMYLITTLIFFIIGGIEALLIRIQLAQPEQHVVSPNTYDRLFTMHGTTMIFLVIMPMLLGFANYFVPLMIGARDMAFPRLNAMSLWLLVFGGILLYFSFLVGDAPDVGWFAYSPLTEPPFAMGKGVDYWALGTLVTSFGTIATGINLIVTVAKYRAPGMTPFRIPIFVWMSLINSFLIIWAIPSLTAAQVMLLFDRHLGTKFFVAADNGSAVLWQHLFWFFGHPEVYIMILPAFGMISEVVSVNSHKPIFGYPIMVAAGIAITFLSATVWAHHMFAVGLGPVQNAIFGATSLLIAIPTGIKIFNWLATMWGGRIRFTTAMLFAIGFIAMFTMGGISGVLFGLFPVDQQLTDSYFVVAHFHYVLFGGTYFAIAAATYYWFPKITGRMLNETLGKWQFWLTLIGFNVTFFPMHILGLMGMPRRAWTYPNLPGWGDINLIETIGSFIIALSVLVFIWNFFLTLRQGEIAGPDPWDGFTLEWATASPPPEYNFDVVPPVHSFRPLHDLKLAAAGAPSADAAPPRPIPPAGGQQHESFLPFLSVEQFGILVFITSEIVFFGALIITFVDYRTKSPSGPGPDVVDTLRTFWFSIALWASSGTIILAERYLRKGRQRAFLGWWIVTIILGAIFLYGQGTEYETMYGHNIKIKDNLFTSSFYTLTGFHGFHVSLGLIALIVVAALGIRGIINPQRRVAAETVSYYWHFVDAVWIVIFCIVYLWPAVS